jgi:hypothetical protein
MIGSCEMIAISMGLKCPGNLHSVYDLIQYFFHIFLFSQDSGVDNPTDSMLLLSKTVRVRTRKR